MFLDPASGKLLAEHIVTGSTSPAMSPFAPSGLASDPSVSEASST